MGRGLGLTQQAILDALTQSDYGWLSTLEIADVVLRDQRQVRAAVDALEARGLVGVKRGDIGWDENRKGPWRRHDPSHENCEVTVVNYHEPNPLSRGEVWHWREPLEICHRPGMPVYGRQVWLKQKQSES